ncbi:phosphatase PAP2 family protein [Anaerofustis stercorihominis]|uniref:Phosphatase PAP2 family protein n=1 Tax=Anaerofustis stercorihominis TaxID=214853 RepID=A0A3E3DZ27_9FIRM|nr:phosphatase PAP2 family protein [Anaerofustis stercorihominis]RGD74483.1 phosphatase PAP2 family protein [Anaerofustis stercorihominis]
MKRVKKSFICSGILFILFAVFTFMVIKVDVSAAGPNRSMIGLSAINKFFFDGLGVSGIWYKITEVLGAIALLTAFGFGVFGLIQLIKRKSLFKVDKDILLLGGFYLIIIAVYVLFENLTINYRPILIDGNLEASFPSTHTMLAVFIMSTAIYQFHNRIKNKNLRYSAEALSSIVLVLTVVGRLLSGVHWFTDIVSGVLISFAFVMLYYAFVKWLRAVRP